MADRVSVLAVTLVCDEKRAARRGGEFLRRDVSCCLQLRKRPVWRLRGSGGHPSAIARGRLSRKAQEMVHPSCFGRCQKKTNPHYTSPLKWPTPPPPPPSLSPLPKHPPPPPPPPSPPPP